MIAIYAFEYFLKEMHKITFYDDVQSVLEELSRKYKLGVLTNGNADINKLKIGHMFDFSISSIDVKSNKPEKNHFLKAQELSKVDFENTLHVGDHPINDILGARKLGIEVMWFNLKKIDWVIDANPPIQFTKWSEFIEIFEINHGY